MLRETFFRGSYFNPVRPTDFGYQYPKSTSGSDVRLKQESQMKYISAALVTLLILFFGYKGFTEEKPWTGSQTYSISK